MVRLVPATGLVAGTSRIVCADLKFSGQVPAICSSDLFRVNCLWDRSLDLRPVPSCKLFRGLQSWTKVLGQIYICGAFSNAPNKQSRANSSTLGQPSLPPSPHLQCWTRVHVISPEFQHCMGGGGVKQRNLKRITVLFENTEKICNYSSVPRNFVHHCSCSD